jgi:cysteine desulfurase
MKRIYLDNAATTPMDPEVLEAMMPYMTEHYGNPSSTHTFGRKTRSAIEISRKNVANYLNVSPGEIFFTSGGTEADNMAITCAVEDLGVEHIITSAIEHHAVGHTVEALESANLVRMSLVNVKDDGSIDLEHLEELLQTNDTTLVSLMHGNNEIGNLLPLAKVGEMCKAYNAYFHSDTVQTMGHYRFDLREINIHFITCAAHKFHGPKGVGFLYVNEEVSVKPMIHGGSQERNMRGGTENLYGIVGLAKAMEIAHREMEEHQQYITGLKMYMKQKLIDNIPGVQFHGDATENGLYTVLNTCFPPSDKGETLLFGLDIAGIAASGGSACTSGSEQGSHVLRSIGADMGRPSVRFSFSKFNTKEEIDFCINTLMEVFAVAV